MEKYRSCFYKYLYDCLERDTINAPTTAISYFLDRLIRPFFDRHVRLTTIIDDADLIHRLQKYVEHDCVHHIAINIVVFVNN